MNAESGAERVRKYRQRKAAQGLLEVRGVYAPPDDHQRIKAYAEGLAKRRKNAGKRQSEGWAL